MNKNPMETVEIKPDVSQVLESIQGSQFHFCGDCNKVCVDKRAYKNHLRSNLHMKKDTTLHCYECNISYSSRYNLQIHLASKKHAPAKRFSCPFCHKRFSTQIYLKRHKMIHSNWTSLHQCKQCWRKFTRHTEYMAHIKMHKAKEVVCLTCKRSFISMSYLVRHKCGKGYECECKKSFRTLRGLRLHQETHELGKCYECGVCGKLFSVKRYLQAHMKYHRDLEESAFCDICFKKFPHKTGLRIHMKIHNEIECEICQVAFHSRSELASHKKIHKLAHVCDICAKSFSYLKHLQRHKLLHDENRMKRGALTKARQKCDKCNKLILLANFSRHNARKHKELEKYICTKCSKQFSTKSDLLLHNKVHQPMHVAFNDSPGLLGYFNYSSTVF